jgi:hypothetical protein
VVFDGISQVRIDSTEHRIDSLFIWTSVKDSSKESDTVYTSQNLHVWTNGNLYPIHSTGTKPPSLSNEPPYFLLGAEMGGITSQARFKDSLCSLETWHISPTSGYGRTLHGASLEGVGMIDYLVQDFGSLARDSRTLRLIHFNGNAFDSSQFEPVSLISRKTRFSSALRQQRLQNSRRSVGQDVLGRFDRTWRPWRKE